MALFWNHWLEALENIPLSQMQFMAIFVFKRDIESYYVTIPGEPGYQEVKNSRGNHQMVQASLVNYSTYLFE